MSSSAEYVHVLLPAVGLIHTMRLCEKVTSPRPTNVNTPTQEANWSIFGSNQSEPFLYPLGTRCVFLFTSEEKLLCWSTGAFKTIWRAESDTDSQLFVEECIELGTFKRVAKDSG